MSYDNTVSQPTALIGLDIISLFQLKRFCDSMIRRPYSLHQSWSGSRAQELPEEFVKNTNLNLNENAFCLKTCLITSLQISSSCKIKLFHLS